MPRPLHHTSTLLAGLVLSAAALGQLTEDTKLTCSLDASGDHFGHAAAADGDVAVIGAPDDSAFGPGSGSVYIWRRTGSAWDLDARLDNFGFIDHGWGTAVDLDGPLMVGGAPGAFGGTIALFEYDGSSWNWFPSPFPSSLLEGDGFGAAVALDANTVAVGAPGKDTAAMDAGGVFVFTWDGFAWTEEALLVAGDAALADGFGSSLALQGDRLVVGAPGRDGGSSDEGAAYAFTRTAGVWSPDGQLLASDPANGAQLGHATALDGDTVVLGASFDDDNGAASGSAYVFVRGATTWSEEDKLTANDGAAGDRFGIGVTLEGDQVWVGSWLADRTNVDEGALYRFERSGGSWSQTLNTSPLGGSEDDRYGSSVALAGDSLVVGVTGADSAGEDSGAAYVLRDSGSSWSDEAYLVPSGNPAFDSLGTSVSLEDTTLLVGAPGLELPEPSYVAVFEFDGMDWVPAAKLVAGDQPEFSSGALGMSCDLDGARALVGAPFADGSVTFSGAAYTFTRSGNDWSEEQKLTVMDTGAISGVGQAVALDGTRALVGAPYSDGAALFGGAAYLFEHDGASWFQGAKLISSDGQQSDAFGYSVALSGDLAFVGAHQHDVSRGAVYIFERSGSVWSQVQKLVASDGETGDLFGCALALDGGRLLIGAFGDDDAASGAGAAYTFVESGGVWHQEQKLVPSGATDFASAGTSVALDGPSALLGAPSASGAASFTGAVYLFQKLGSPWVQRDVLYASDGATDNAHGLGRGVAVEGHRAVAGAPYDAPGTFDARGAAYVFGLPEPIFGTAFCFGDGSGTACPCGNESSLGAGEGCANSTGVGALLSGAGSDSVAVDDLLFLGVQVPAFMPGLLFSGPNAINGGNGIPFGDGLRCVGGSVLRLGVRFADSSGQATWGPGILGLGGFAPGSTQRFQLWYRDPSGSPCGELFNLSNALEVLFAP